MRAEDIRTALARKFAAPEFALFYEVGDATGGRARRWADAVAMGLWPSRGLFLQGFEIKVSRSDLLSELKNPEKAESVARYCRYWWLATPPGLVRDGELPEGWGLYEAHPNGLRCIKQAPVNEHCVPVTMAFLAALLRRADEHAKSMVAGEVRKQTEALRESVDKRVKDAADREREDILRRNRGAADTLAAIKKAAQAEGFDDSDILRWFDAEEFGRAVALVRELGVTKTYGGLRDIADKLAPLAEAVGRLVAPQADELAEETRERKEVSKNRQHLSQVTRG